MASYGLPAHAKATPRPDPLLFLGGPACRSPGIRSQRASQGHINGFLWASSAGKSYPKARSIAVSGRSSVPFARHSYGLPAQAKATQGQIHCCLWAIQRAVRQAFAANGHPKATSMASYGLPAQAKATPRPDPLLFLGGPASRWPGIRSQQASQGHIHGFLWASKLAVCQP